MSRIFFFGGLAALMAGLVFMVPVSAAGSPIVISEVQTGAIIDGRENGQAEFIELYNNTSQDIDVTDWRVEYLSASHDGGVNPTRILATLDGYISAESYVLIASEAYAGDADLTYKTTSTTGSLAKTGGHVRVVDAANTVIDVLGWGSANRPETKAIREIPAGSSAQRLAAEDGLLLDTGNNALDFAVSPAVSPAGGGQYVPAPVETNTSKDPGGTAVTVPPLSTACMSAEITEIMANPAGSDTDTKTEFIELYNPTPEVIGMKGCVLSTSANTRKYAFEEGVQLSAGEYRAFSLEETGLTLINGGGEVTLAANDSESSYAYPTLGDDQAWMLMDDGWTLTDLATPGAANQLIEKIEAADLAVCPSGKYRNPATGRCKSTEPVKAQTPCDPGQQRNAETNRCRTIITSGAALTPCQSGYVRNPDTNRCRKVAGATADLKACDPGYERNPATNRCRKAATNAAPLVAGVSTPKSSVGGMQFGDAQWWGLGIVGAGALSYGLYEWREELLKGGKRALAAVPFVGRGK